MSFSFTSQIYHSNNYSHIDCLGVSSFEFSLGLTSAVRRASILLRQAHWTGPAFIALRARRNDYESRQPRRVAQIEGQAGRRAATRKIVPGSRIEPEPASAA